jgi:pimeloyl-ACP methyl ester carboxylesterase
VSRTLFFIHGSGRAGTANWPVQLERFADSAFLTMPGYGEEEPTATRMEEWVDRVTSLDGELDIVAHSYGGVAAIFSAAREPERVRSLTLFEPAAYAYARGRPRVEATIERMTPIVKQAPLLDAAEYQVGFMTALTGSRPKRPSGPVEILAAERNRLLVPPWSFDLPTGVLSAIPTLVLTGGWNGEYEEIGEAMAEAGSRHDQLVGFGHRVQDHPDANSAISEWLASRR